MTTIHQPRNDILELFDKIILLSAGKIVFFGPLDAAIAHFESLGYPLPPKTNPSDYFIDIITLDQRSEQLKSESLARIEMFSKAWEERSVEPLIILPNNEISTYSTGWPSTWIGEFIVLLNRNLKDVSRDIPTLGATLGQGIIICLLMGFLFVSCNVKPFSGKFNSIQLAFKIELGSCSLFVGFKIILGVNQTFGVIMPTLAVFPTERQIIKRERAGASYRASSSYLAKVVSTLPLTIAGVLILTVPVYWMIGLQNNIEKVPAFVTQYFTFILIVLVHSLAMSSLGIAIGSAVPSVRVGQIVGPLIIVVFLLFGGQLINLDSLPDALKWIQYISAIAYSNKALSQNEFTGLKFSCPDPRALCYRDGDQVLQVFKYNSIGLWPAVLVNVAIGVGFLIVGFVAFARTSKPVLKLK